MLDTSIALQARGPEDPLARYGKVLALKNAIDQGKINQQQMQSGQLDLQQKQQDMQDQQVFRQILTQTNGDYEKAAPLLAGKVSPKLTQQLQNAILDHQDKVVKLDKDKLEVQAKKDEYAANGLNAVTAAPPEQQPFVYAQFRKDAIASGHASESDIPAEYDPGWVLTHKFLSTPVNQQNTAALQAKTAQERLGVEKNKAVDEKDAKLLNAIAAARSQEELDALRKQAVDAGISKAALGRTPAMFSPQAMEGFGRSLVTQEQRVQADQAKTNAAAAAARDAETVRKNNAEIRQGDERIRISKESAEKAKMPVNAPPAVIKGVISNDQLVSDIDEAIAELGKHPEAVGYKNVLSEGVVNRFVNPGGVDARSLVAKIAGKEFHDLSGAAVSISEAARLKPFIPSQTDSAEVATKKLRNLKRSVVEQNQATREAYPEDKYREIPKVKPQTEAAPKYKAGETRNINGVTYTRDKDGNWR